MKKLKIIVCAVLALCLLTACGSKAVDPGMDAVSAAVAAVIDPDGTMTDLSSSVIESMMKMDSSDYAECAAKITSVGTSIDEYGVFKASDSSQAGDIAKALEAYLQLRLDAWMDEYLPEELPKLKSAEVWTEGNYVMYAIVSDDMRAAAKDAFTGCFAA